MITGIHVYFERKTTTCNWITVVLEIYLISKYIVIFPFIFSSIDPSQHEGLGKMVNDARKPNCKMKKIVLNGKPHLCLFAITNIEPETELRYNYGDLPASELFWRKVNAVSFHKVLKTIICSY